MTHSFPTRRSSDLVGDQPWRGIDLKDRPLAVGVDQRAIHETGRRRLDGRAARRRLYRLECGRFGSGLPECGMCNDHARSEEHTSELQSLMRISYAVFWLKKNKKQMKI